MSKKSKIKLAVNKAMKHYYKSGLTNTAGAVRKEILKEIDKVFKEK